MLDRYQAIDPSRLDHQPGARMLDVGCGSGRHLLEFSHMAGTFVGLDMSRADLKMVRFMYRLRAMSEPVEADWHIVQGDGYRLPFDDGEFDHVICTETLEHVPDDRGLVRELVRVLRPQGVLVISVPDEYSERLLWRFSLRYRSAPGGHVRIYRRKHIKQLLRDHGAELFDVQYRQSLEAMRWLSRSVLDSDWDEPGRITKAICWLLDTPSHRDWQLLSWADAVGSYLLPKSIVLYGRKIGQASS